MIRAKSRLLYEGGDIMKSLTTNQVNELNELLKDHSSTLTAFYDEGISYGMRKGYLIGFTGCLVGSLSTMIVAEIVKYKNSQKSDKES